MFAPIGEGSSYLLCASGLETVPIPLDHLTLQGPGFSMLKEWVHCPIPVAEQVSLWAPLHHHSEITHSFPRISGTRKQGPGQRDMRVSFAYGGLRKLSPTPDQHRAASLRSHRECYPAPESSDLVGLENTLNPKFQRVLRWCCSWGPDFESQCVQRGMRGMRQSPSPGASLKAK